MGVTRDQITLVGAFRANMISFFNQRFEFYGRKLVVSPQPSNPAPTGSSCTVSGQAQADADAALQPFASGLFFGSCMAAYMDQAARNHVINVAAQQAPMPESFLSAHAPYAWSYQMAFENIQRTMGAWGYAGVGELAGSL
jgi:hypothetical protein